MSAPTLPREFSDPYFPPVLDKRTLASEAMVNTALRAARDKDKFRELEGVTDSQISSRPIRKRVRDICQKYWKEKSWSSVWSVSDSAAHAKKMASYASKLIEAIESAPQAANGAIFMVSGESIDWRASLSHLSQLEESCRRVSETKGTAGRPSLHIHGSLSRIAELWEVLTGAEFPKSVVIQKGDFGSPAAAFALRILRAIDTEDVVAIRQVASAIKRFEPRN